ncbi:MAG: VWA domain-containing protein [Synechococcales cyanobacterium C42_A2020_086]|jgi:hypothetical protein|nr:VWA domain-containing protein [Synechococcales cyanobacterium C42_A2020_086]
MEPQFTAEVFQNPYLPQGAKDVNAIMTITLVGNDSAVTHSSGHLFGIICDVSGSMGGLKIQAAKAAMARVVTLLPEDSAFFIVTGSSTARLIVPVMTATPSNKQEAIAAINNVTANGGTLMSTWLTAALREFQTRPTAIRQALLLTDGMNDDSDENALAAILKQCEGVFQCDCRGVGTDWRVAQLQRIADKLLGTTDIIPDASGLEADFQAILQKALTKTISDVHLRLWTPQGAKVLFCKQVSPTIVDLTGRAKPVKPQVVDYPTGSWSVNEPRDYHFCIEVPAGNVGDEMLAGRASLVCWINEVETKISEARILATWTDNEALSAKIDRRVAHYTGQAELAQVIQEGMEARARGNVDVATAKLGRAVQLAHESGNESTAKLLRNVVDVEDASTGTVRLKRDVAKADAMALETRSTKTTRIPKDPS